MKLVFFYNVLSFYFMYLFLEIILLFFRAMASGSSYMKKQELIDAAEASGLTRTAIA